MLRREHLVLADVSHDNRVLSFKPFHHLVHDVLGPQRRGILIHVLDKLAVAAPDRL